MKIEIWSDFLCPFCYIGKRKLEMALAQLPFIKDPEIVYKSFELNPEASLFNGTKIEVELAAKYGMSIDQARQNNQQIKQVAAEVGLAFDFEAMKPTNSLAAHRLAKYAKTTAFETEFVEALYQAYFEEGQLISDAEILSAIATEVGLEKVAVQEVLADDSRYLEEVRQDENEAYQFGISSVPYFVLDQKYAIQGAQPMEIFIKALTDMWAEGNATDSIQQQSDMMCDETGCEIKKS